MYHFTCSWLARTYYLRPIQEHVDDYLEYYFRCNSTLTNMDTVYNVDCMHDENLSDTLSLLIRREDATVVCPKSTGNYSFNPGVSQNTIYMTSEKYQTPQQKPYILPLGNRHYNGNTMQ